MNFTAVPFAVASPLLLGLVFDIEGDYFVAVLLLAAVTAAAIPAAYLMRLSGPSQGQREPAPRPATVAGAG